MTTDTMKTATEDEADQFSEGLLSVLYPGDVFEPKTSRLKRFVETKIKSLKPEALPYAAFNVGLAFEVVGNFLTAEGENKMAVEVYREAAEYYCKCLSNSPEPIESAASVKLANGLAPAPAKPPGSLRVNARARCQLGRIYLDVLKMPDKAETIYTALIRIYELESYSLTQIAIAKFKKLRCTFEMANAERCVNTKGITISTKEFTDWMKTKNEIDASVASQIRIEVAVFLMQFKKLNEAIEVYKQIPESVAHQLPSQLQMVFWLNKGSILCARMYKEGIINAADIYNDDSWDTVIGCLKKVVEINDVVSEKDAKRVKRMKRSSFKMLGDVHKVIRRPKEADMYYQASSLLIRRKFVCVGNLC